MEMLSHYLYILILSQAVPSIAQAELPAEKFSRRTSIIYRPSAHYIAAILVTMSGFLFGGEVERIPPSLLSSCRDKLRERILDIHDAICLAQDEDNDTIVVVAAREIEAEESIYLLDHM